MLKYLSRQDDLGRTVYGYRGKDIETSKVGKTRSVHRMVAEGGGRCIRNLTIDDPRDPRPDVELEKLVV